MAKYVFIAAFVVSVFFQGFALWKFDMADTGMWANQAEYVYTSNPEQFDFLAAYGHPGGPIIEGVILLHEVLNVSYNTALLIFLSVIDGLIIAGACLLCFLLSRNHFWWPVVLPILSLNGMYDYSTPPSTVASLLVVFLFLLTLFYIKKEEPLKSLHLALWGLVSGLLISTRVDIGTIMSLSFLVVLIRKTSWRQLFLAFACIVVSFMAFDPFMWFMPLQHIKDLLYKITYHYNDFEPTKIGFWYLLSFSSFSIISMFVSGALISLKKQDKIMLPAFFFKILTITTVALYIIFLTARYQAPRYFLPLVLIWEVILPVSVFSLVEGDNVKSKNPIRIFIMLVLVLYSAGLFMHSLWINGSYNLL